MKRYKVVEDTGIYFTTHTVVEWLPIFKETKYFEIIIQSLKHCQEKKGQRSRGICRPRARLIR